MLTDKLRAAGWRECPSKEVRDAWEAKGGRWQVACHWFNIGCPSERGTMTLLKGEQRPAEADEPYRPVSAETWDYDPRGWGEQPTPATGDQSVPVFDTWCELLENATQKHPDQLDAIRELYFALRERYDLGMAKYGQPLMSFDGRDSLKDLKDEFLDAWMYSMKLTMEGRAEEALHATDRLCQTVQLVLSVAEPEAK